jgi:carbonic anhydrase
LAVPRLASAQTTISPDTALKTLMDGNRRFVDRKLTFYQEDLAILQQQTVEKQQPFASVLSCADSRMPVELIFDQSIGDIFVNRVAGNIATTEIMASIEYGAAVLGTRVIMVLGHANCGAIKPQSTARRYQARSVRCTVIFAPRSTRRAIISVRQLRPTRKSRRSLSRSPLPYLPGLVKERKLSVVAAYFDLESGKVSLLS